MPPLLLNLAALAFFGLCWGMTVPLTKIAVSAGHHPLGLVFWQLGFSAILLAIPVALRRIRLPVDRRSLVYYLIIATIGTLVPNTFSFMSSIRLPAGIMAISIATVPILSLIIALLFRLEPPEWKRLSGVVLGVSALMLIALPETSLPDRSMMPWVLVSLIAPLCYAIEGNFVAARAPESLTPMGTLLCASCLGILILTPIVWPLNMGVNLFVVWDESRWAILGAAVGHVIAYSGYLWLLGRAGAVFTSQVAYIVTLTGVFGAMWLLEERYGYSVWLAVALMLLGVALVRPANRAGQDVE